MPIAIPATRQALANTYASQGTYVGLATGAPGNTSAPANEASGGSYARIATTWTAGTAGTQTGSAVTISVAAGTYTYGILCSSATGNTMVDNAAISSTTLGTAGTIVLTPNFTQS